MSSVPGAVERQAQQAELLRVLLPRALRLSCGDSCLRHATPSRYWAMAGAFFSIGMRLDHQHSLGPGQGGKLRCHRNKFLRFPEQVVAKP